MEVLAVALALLLPVVVILLLALAIRAARRPLRGQPPETGRGDAGGVREPRRPPAPVGAAAASLPEPVAEERSESEFAVTPSWPGEGGLLAG